MASCFNKPDSDVENNLNLDSKQETNEHPIDSSIHHDLARSFKKLHFTTGLDAP